MKNRIEILGVPVDTLTKQELLIELNSRLDSNRKTFITTPYSEFFVYAQKNYKFKETLSRADFSVADGIGTVWAASYLKKPFKLQNFYAKIFEAFDQAIISLLQILFNRSKVFDTIPEKIPGSELFWDLLEISEKKKLKVFLLGGDIGVAQKTAEVAQRKYPELLIVGTSSANASDEGLVEHINKANPDILMVCFGPVKQELWIHENLPQLNAKLFIGLGGTFDYVSGEKAVPPSWIRSIGLEWFFRLLTQPSRIKRVWDATITFVLMCIRHKVLSSMPFRQNVVGVIINSKKEVFVARRLAGGYDTSASIDGEDHWQFPQGGTDGEEPEKAILREIGEETGLNNLKILGKASRAHTYTWNQTTRDLFFQNLRYKGQIQEIFFVQYDGDDSDIKLDQKEFDIYKWVKVQDLEKTVHPFRKKILEIVLEDIGKYI